MSARRAIRFAAVLCALLLSAVTLTGAARAENDPPTVIPAPVGDPTVSPAPNPAIFQIQPGQSTARFTIVEILGGAQKTVVGTTNRVAGQITLDLSQPGSAQVGTISVDARDLATDDPQRNRMIEQFILASDQYPSILFVPTAISGLPQFAGLGTAYPFQMTGQLTIRGVSRSVTFTVTTTPVSATELKGTATATVNYPDWGITIPQVPLVANVYDQVQLDLTFDAVAL